MRLDGLALGAASGWFKRFKTSRKIGCLGTRMATVSFPAVTKSGTTAFLGSTRVRGPGQKVEAAIFANSFTSPIFSACSNPRTCTINGLVAGLPLRVKIFLTATSFSASPASPYTVSVGSATMSPPFQRITASSTEMSKLGGEG